MKEQKRSEGAGNPAQEISVRGAAGKQALCDFLRTELPSGLKVSAGPAPEPLLVVLFLDAPLRSLEGSEWEPGGTADIVLVDWGVGFAGESELGLERSLKSDTGAAKVLIFTGEEGRRRAFGKVRDLALSAAGGVQMPEEIPEKVIEAVKREAVEGRIECETAQRLAGELGVPIPVVGRALDLLGIKITSCQLGCF